MTQKKRIPTAGQQAIRHVDVNEFDELVLSPEALAALVNNARAIYQKAKDDDKPQPKTPRVSLPKIGFLDKASIASFDTIAPSRPVATPAARTCQYPIGKDEDGLTLYCDEPTAGLRHSYCADHKTACHVRTKPMTLNPKVFDASRTYDKVNAFEAMLPF